MPHDDYVPIHNFRSWSHTEAGRQLAGTDSGVPPGEELERAIDLGLCARREPDETAGDGDDEGGGVTLPDELPDDYGALRSLAADVKEATGEPYPDSMDTEALTAYIRDAAG